MVWCVGRWQDTSGVSDVFFEIDLTVDGFRILAIDEYDGEELVVSKVKWERGCLSFETRTPSNGWHTKNKFRPASKNKIIQELTYWQPLEKIPGKVRRVSGTTSRGPASSK